LQITKSLPSRALRPPPPRNPPLPPTSGSAATRSTRRGSETWARTATPAWSARPATSDFPSPRRSKIGNGRRANHPFPPRLRQPSIDLSHQRW